MGELVIKNPQKYGKNATTCNVYKGYEKMSKVPLTISPE
jgi:hypothetical protein